MRLAPAMWTGAGVAVFLCSSWLALAGAGRALAQSEAVPRQGEAERLMRSLTGENDASFDALIDPCIVANGRRISPGKDSDKAAAEQPGRTDGGTPAGASRTESGVT